MKPRGKMRPLTEEQIAAIRANLSDGRHPRDLAIFETWLHSCLRVSDFRELVVGDVLGEHGIRSRVVSAMRKVSTARRCRPVEFDLPPRAREALARLIQVDGKRPQDFLFTHPKRPREPLCRQQLGRLVKSWVLEIGGDPHRVNSHTMRRTRPVIAIRKGTARIEHVRYWLGHSSIAVTAGYIGIEAEDAILVSEQNAL
jgi:integrase